MTYDSIVLHSGGMDSSLCLYLAAKQYGEDRVLSLGFQYGQRHAPELTAAETIASHFGIRRVVISVPPLPGWETSSLLAHSIPIHIEGMCPNSIVRGRNGLFLMMAAPLAHTVGAHELVIGVMEREGSYSGYPDCSREYIDRVQAVVRLDLQDSSFSIQTPLIQMSKADTMRLADDCGVLDYLLEKTVTCYNGISAVGCQECPSCRLRNQGIIEFYRSHPKRRAPHPFSILFPQEA